MIGLYMLADVVVLGKNYGKDDFAGFYDPESETIYLNVAKMTGSHGQITSLLANELSHYVDEKKGDRLINAGKIYQRSLKRICWPNMLG